MKHYSLLAALTAATLILAGCNKETPAPAGDPDAGVKSVTLSLNWGKLTKAQVTPDDNWAAKAGITRIDIYFTTASDAIRYSKRIDSTTDETLWDNITGETGNNRIRFIGLTNVSRVYVVANDSEAIRTEGNISDITADLANMYGSKNNTDVLYFGGDEDLTPIGNEPADNVGATFDETGAPISNPESDESMSSQYYSADVDIRPAISRLEIGKIAIQNTGSGEVSVQYNNDPEKTYVVEYRGFQPELVGIYMSNFYGTLTPVNATLGNYFPTPEETGVISAGLWDNDKINKTADIAAAYNQDGITLYSNYATGSYSALFANAPGPSGDEYVYFNGNGTTCVPFNFIVPFNHLDGSDMNIPAESGFAGGPKFHFQFYYPADAQDNYTITKIYDKALGEVDGNVDPVDEAELYNTVAAAFTIPATEDDLYYANVTSFLPEDEGDDTPVEIEPNTIYRMGEVLVTPSNIGTGTVKITKYNIIVRVEIIDYNQINVRPSFD